VLRPGGQARIAGNCPAICPAAGAALALWALARVTGGAGPLIRIGGCVLALTIAAVRLHLRPGIPPAIAGWPVRVPHGGRVAWR
jgi:hypothetical protein